jgi:hypothetical protein
MLPNTKRLVVAMNDSAPEHFDWAAGTHDHSWRWPPASWADRARAFGMGGRRSWLSVDAAVDERCLVISDKGQETTVMWLDHVGRPTGEYVGLAKKQREPMPEDLQLGRFIVKGPSRGAAATVHPQDDVAVFLDISGRMFVTNARTGELLRLVDDAFAPGYRWNGLSALRG